jgi:hypothetical protein
MLAQSPGKDPSECRTAIATRHPPDAATGAREPPLGACVIRRFAEPSFSARRRETHQGRVCSRSGESPALRETCTPSWDLDEVCEGRSKAERRFSRGPGAVTFSTAYARRRADRQGSSQLIFRNIERARAYVDDLFKPSSTSARRRLHAKFFCPNQPRENVKSEGDNYSTT